jgi:alanine racemase
MREISELPNLEIAGTYTHFANAGASDLADARRQSAKFSALISDLKSSGIPTGLCHAANSSAILSLPESHLDMVRPGTILYGQYPTTHVEKKLDLEETWRFKTRIIALRKFPAGTPIGYGSEFTTKRPTIAGVIPVGYAEGFTVVPGSVANRKSNLVKTVAAKLLKTRTSPSVVIRGERIPVIGRVSMQITSIDVTSIPDVRVGDEVIVPTRRVTTSSRLPRVYVE